MGCCSSTRLDSKVTPENEVRPRVKEYKDENKPIRLPEDDEHSVYNKQIDLDRQHVSRFSQIRRSFDNTLSMYRFGFVTTIYLLITNKTHQITGRGLSGVLHSSKNKKKKKENTTSPSSWNWHRFDLLGWSLIVHTISVLVVYWSRKQRFSISLKKLTNSS